jgi:hypothetical protein
MKTKITIFIIVLIFLTITGGNLLSQDGTKSLLLDNTNWLSSGKYIDCGIPQFGATDKITVSAWVRETFKDGSDQHEGGYQWATIASLDNHSLRDNGQFWLQHSTNDTRFEWLVYGTSQKYLYSTTQPVLNKWYFVTGVYDATNSPHLRLYVNGVLESSSDAISGNVRNVDPAKYVLNIGRIPSSYRFFNGYIDDLRIYWGTALSTDQIRQQMFSKNTVVSTNLVRYYTFDQSTGIGVIDSANSGTVNATYYSAVVDVHGLLGSNTGFDRNLKIIQDSDKVWTSNSWAGKTFVTIAGKGFGVNVDRTIVSNSLNNKLTLDSWVNSNSTNDPITDIPGSNLPNMTYFAIKDVNASGQWANSTAPLCNNFGYIKTTTPTSVGPVGGNITGTITSTPGSANNIALYQWGITSGTPVTNGETFPGTVNKRSNIVWGIQSWGTVTTNLIINYSSIGGVSSNVKLLRRNRDDTTWTDITSSATLNYSLSTYTYNGVTGSYEFALGEDANSPMPVEIKTFNSSVLKNNVLLNWTSFNENNNSGFEIQRFDFNNWNKTGFVTGKGNSVIPVNYSFEDKNLNSGKYKYRLKQIDHNGNFCFYNLNNEVEIGTPKTFELEQNYPNPFNPVTKINYQIPFDGNVLVKIYDLTGREIKVLNNKIEKAGYHSLTFDASGLPSGIYIFRINFSGNGSALAKIMKLSLVK